MFFTPYFGGCKYTNKILFINKIIVFQHFDLLITPVFYATPLSCHVRLQGQTLNRSRVRPLWKPTRSFEGVFVSDGTRNTTKTPENGTVTQNFRQKVAWRYPKAGVGGRKRDRQAKFRAKLCLTVGSTAFCGENTAIVRQTFIHLPMTSWHFERDVENDRRERTCKR